MAARGWLALVPLLALAVLLLAAAAPARAADTTPPSLLSAAPFEGQFFNAAVRMPGGIAKVQVTAALEDASSPLAAANVTASVLDLRTGAAVAPSSVNTSNEATNRVQVAASFDLGEGPYRLALGATDEAGNGASFERNFTVDFTPPTLEVFASPTVNGSTVTVRIDVRDAVSGVGPPIYLSYKSACSYLWATAPFEVTELPGRLVGEASFTACVGADNEYSVAAADRAGNPARTVSGRVAFDLNPPTFRDFSPGPFATLDGPRVPVAVWVSDDATGVNSSTVAVQYSNDGGLTWSNWTAARTSAAGPGVSAVADIVPADGATVALRWRASDLAGNGPSISRVQYFYVNGAPFLTALEPAEGAVIPEYHSVRLYAEFADPDADAVDTSFSSDLDGPLGPADGRQVQLRVGVHNLTVVGDDHHGHRAAYTYQVEVVPRPAPDPRPLYFTAVLAGAMVWASYAAWARGEDEEEGTDEGTYEGAGEGAGEPAGDSTAAGDPEPPPPKA